MTVWTDILTSLQNSGLTGSALTSAAQSVAQAISPASSVKAALATVMANINNPAVAKDEATKIAELQNVPAAVVGLLPLLANASTPQEIMAAVQALETALQGAGLGGVL